MIVVLFLFGKIFVIVEGVLIQMFVICVVFLDFQVLCSEWVEFEKFVIDIVSLNGSLKVEFFIFLSEVGVLLCLDCVFFFFNVGECLVIVGLFGLGKIMFLKVLVGVV